MIKKINVRVKIWEFVIYKIFKIPEGHLVPKKLWWIGAVLFPIQAIRSYPDANPRIDFFSQCIIYRGVRIDLRAIKNLASEWQLGTTFTVLSRDDGYITLKRNV